AALGIVVSCARDADGSAGIRRSRRRDRWNCEASLPNFPGTRGDHVSDALHAQRIRGDRRMTTFKLPPLPFDERALEPSMSAETVKFQDDKHHAAYITKTNSLVAEIPDAPATLEEVVRWADKDKNAKLFNQSAQAWNHGFFWQSLTPEAQGGAQGDLS